jgi:hypothetical protein
MQKINALRFSRLWVVLSDWGRTGVLEENERSIKEWLDKTLKMERQYYIDGSWLLVYKH